MGLIKQERPLQLFTDVASLLFVFALGLPVASEFLQSGLVPRLPTAVLAASSVLLSFLLFASGLILDSVAHGRREINRLAYLALPAPACLVA
ncbi:hypothetical protein [Rhodopila sp.]|uniref:hypothetical protein n=1 Tax=Rhodopila sp. TaxID=2480087 RepID=UPI003D144BA2